MSGGYYDYLCFKVAEFAARLETNGSSSREEFKKLMILVSDACYAIEWEDSGDTDTKATDDAIKTVFEFLPSTTPRPYFFTKPGSDVVIHEAAFAARADAEKYAQESGLRIAYFLTHLPSI